MKTLACILIGAAALAGFVYLARTQTSEAEHVPWTRYGTSFYVNDTSYLCDLERSNILSSPPWTPSAPLPLRPDKAVEVARAELQNLVQDGRVWKVTAIDLRSLAVTRPAAENAWYFCVHFEPTTHPRLSRTNLPRYVENAVICVDFAGRPGVIRGYGKIDQK
jgi:hypothetical protein